MLRARRQMRRSKRRQSPSQVMLCSDQGHLCECVKLFSLCRNVRTEPPLHQPSPASNLASASSCTWMSATNLAASPSAPFSTSRSLQQECRRQGTDSYPRLTHTARVILWHDCNADLMRR